LLCHFGSAQSDGVLRQAAELCAGCGAQLSVVMPVVDATVPDGCCGIQGEQWRRLMDEDAREAMQRAVRLLQGLGCAPVNVALEVGPSVAAIAQQAAARFGCDVVAVSRRRWPWSTGLSRRQAEKVRRAGSSRVVELAHGSLPLRPTSERVSPTA
jgi:nucleotide-binding universal stress UspA family protein